jgi:CHAT domain-containing protein/tetratricopeptide (TPR) repeat protein
MPVIGFLAMSLIPATFADEPKPQWQRMLTGEDAKKAQALQKRFEEFADADNFPEAIQTAESLLELRTKLQGADHWETVNQKWAVAALRKVAALSKEKRAGWRKAAEGDSQAGRLEEKAQHAKATSLRQERLSWCREVLGEDHPLTAKSYNSVAFNLGAQAKYAEAGPPLQKALDIRRKVLGEDHPDTAQSYNNVGFTLGAQSNYAEAGPLLQKALDIRRKVLGEDHSLTALSYNNVAANLNALAKYAEAGPLFQKALNIRCKVLGEDHSDTASSYNNVAANLQARGAYAEAGPLYQKALDIYRKVLGEDHSLTALSYNNVAANLNAQGRYAEAGPLYQQALDINRKVLGEAHPHTALSYNNVAANLNAQGRYAEAGPLYQKALDIRRKVLGENHPHTAGSYNNLAFNLDSQAKYVEARPLLEKSLHIRRKVLGEDHPDTAAGYNGVAASLNAQAKYAEAEPLFQKALDIRRKLLGEDHPYTAVSYNNLAFNLSAQAKYAEAGLLFQKALDIRRKILGEDHPDTAAGYNGVATNLNAQAKYAEAGPLLQKALDIRRKLLGEDHADTALSYFNLAFNLNAQAKYLESLPHLEGAVRSYEEARLNLAHGGLERATYGTARSPYHLLAATYRRERRFAEAFLSLEADLARGLLDEIASRRGSIFSPVEQEHRSKLVDRISPMNARILALATRGKRTAAEAGELNQLIQDRQEVEKSLIDMAVAASRREVTSLDRLQAALPDDAAFIAWVDVSDMSGGVEEHWGCLVRSTGEPHWERLPGTGSQGKWANEDAELTEQFRGLLAKSASSAQIDAAAKKLNAQRLASLTKHLNGVKRLFVAPVNQMAGIPIEALTDKYIVSYTPSGTYLARLKDRERPRHSAVLAVGDPLFPPTKESPQPKALPPGGLLITQVVPGGNAAKVDVRAGDVLVAYAGENLSSMEQLDKLLAANANAKSVVVQVWREGQKKSAERELAPGRMGVNLAKEPAREAIAARRQTDQMLAKVTRGESYSELPGTQVEIERISKLFDVKNVTTLTRADASEQRLDEMRKADKLRQFKYLHFATHGKANNFRSFDSALILSPPERIPEPRANEPWLDGRLTAAEVLEYWKLDTELVTLSACESALGRPGGGDGLLGFAQAFLLAGSRSVCLTLWQVDDTATALLMDRFYRNLLGKRDDGSKPMGKAAALHEAKHWLRNLSASEALERLGTLTNGVVRGERPAREEMKPVPVPKDAGKDYKPYAHPRYWAAFILIGDPG